MLSNRSSGNFENSATVSTRERHVAWALSAAAILAALWTWVWKADNAAPNRRVYNGKTLETWFSYLHGSQEETVIAIFREIGADAVIFLGAESRNRDSVLSRGYLALWPKLPTFVKSQIKQPTNTVSIRVKAVGAS